MQPQNIQLVQESFEMVRPIADTAAALFYARLFELDFSLRSLFKHDMRQQGAMLMSTIGLAVNGLGKPESIVAAVRSLGQRHAGYGVRPEQYLTVGEALVWTLERGLGAAFTPEVKAAWLEAYRLLADLMLDAARQAAQPVAAVN